MLLGYRGYQRKRLNSRLSKLVKERTEQLQNTNQKLRDAYEKVEALSLSDSLTGLNNRLYVEQHIHSDLDLSQRAYENHYRGKQALPKNADLILFILDLDHFKQINDRFGHDGGDRVLIQLKARLKSVFRESDYLIRWGGEEFVCVARQTDRREATDIAARLLTAVSDTSFDMSPGSLDVTCSVGFACFPLVISEHGPAGQFSTLLKLADHCLYASKRSGRNCFVGIESISTRLSQVEKLSTTEIQGLLNEADSTVVTSLESEQNIRWP